MRPGAPGPADLGALRKPLRRQHRALPARKGDAPARPGPPELGSGGGRQSSEPALAEVATVLPLVPGGQHPKGKAAPRRGQQSPPVLKEGGCGAPVSTRKPAPPRTKGSPPPYGEPGAPESCRGSPKRRPDAEQRPETCAQRPLPWPSLPAPPPPPAHYSGFSPASAEEVEESVRTLGSL